jgi:succinoglycan biosynthesis transport protein ExoP
MPKTVRAPTANDLGSRVTVAQYLRVLRQQWFVVLLLAALSVGGAVAYTVRQTPVYSATTQLFVVVSGSESNVSELSQGSDFIQQRVKSYTDIATSPQVLEPVIARLHLHTTAAGLAGRVTVESPLDTVLLNLSVTDSDPAQAAQIANAVARQFPDFIAEIETPAGQVKSPVRLSVTKLATIPQAPVSPRAPLNIALGLLVGLGIGIGAAVLRDQLNTSISGVSDVEKLTGAIPLGVVPYDPGAQKHPLVEADQQSARAEAFRTLRTNLQFADVDHPPRVIVVTSPLPSEGKSTSACNVALTLALGGARVVLVDGDLRKPAVGKYLGISNAAGLTSVLAGRHDLRDVVVAYGRETLSILPSGPTPPNPSELLGSQQMADLLTTLANHYDIVVVDAPPLLPVTDAAVLASAADGAVLVLRHGKTRREEAERAIQALAAVNAKLLGTVLNFAPKRVRRSGYDGYGYGYGYGTPATAPPMGASPTGARSMGASQMASPPMGAPSMGAPSMAAPSMGTPSMGAPSMDTRSGAPSMGARSTGTPSGAPSMDTPGINAPTRLATPDRPRRQAPSLP